MNLVLLTWLKYFGFEICSSIIHFLQSVVGCREGQKYTPIRLRAIFGVDGLFCFTK